MRLTTEEFAALVETALADLPAPFAKRLENISVDIELLPDRDTCLKMGIDDPHRLLGLYRGTPLTRRSVEDTGRLPDRIVIFQRSIERTCRSRADIIAQVRKTVFHEIGHFFGLDEDDLADLGYG